MRTALVGAALALGAARPETCAASNVSYRGMLNLGPWISSFEQTDGTHGVQFSSLIGPGLQLVNGIQVRSFFAEYVVTWNWAQHMTHSGNPKQRDAVYYSVAGGNVGYELPFAPVDLHVGLDYGNYKLSAGTNPRFGGLAPHLGATWYPWGVEHLASLGFKLEYRRFFGAYDDAGAIPDSIRTRADLWFLGAVFGFR